MTRQPLRWGAPARRVAVSGRPKGLRLGLCLSPGMRVGLFGGSFNPAHEGHAHVAEVAMERMGLDRLIWLVSPQNPLKSGQQTAPLAQRMTDAGRLTGHREIVSDLETRLGVVYTLDTIRILKARFPGVHFVWIMGSDNLAGFHRWRGWTDILRALPVAVVARPGALIQSRLGPLLPGTPAPAWMFLRGPLSTASSTAIRAARSQGA